MNIRFAAIPNVIPTELLQADDFLSMPHLFNLLDHVDQDLDQYQSLEKVLKQMIEKDVCSGRSDAGVDGFGVLGGLGNVKDAMMGATMAAAVDGSEHGGRG
ncbi:hypothetical protein M0R45_009256 [Rubus argutus]|uniref:Uncharacterized protein n=1 Tax=Rubus argutus TaxID=59490 RepID=A0AAW1Y3M3_RUBAR